MTSEIKRQPGRPKGTGRAGQIRYLSEEELVRFFCQAKRSPRNALLFNLILFFGLRSREAAEMKISGFDQTNLAVTIAGLKHGLKRQYDDVPDSLWSLFKKYLKVRKAHQLNPYLFPHRFDARGHVTPVGVQSLFRRTCKAAGLSGHSVHDLRHTRGRQLALMNFSTPRIARHLRQRSPMSAQQYIDLKDDSEADEKIRQEYSAY
jgi:integrase